MQWNTPRERPGFHEAERRRSQTTKRIAWSIGLLLAIGFGTAWLLSQYRTPQGVTGDAPMAPVEQRDEEVPEIRHPIPDAQNAPPLPALEQSDELALAEAATAIGQPAVEQLLIPQNLIRHAVVTIDNLPRSRLAVRQRPVAAPSGKFVTESDGEAVTLSPDNHARYRPFVEAIQAADTERVAAAYFRLYPLFQQAYEELGYPGRYFNDRLIEVVDHLLETPDVAGPIRLVQPKVFYQFEDPALESRSAGQKILIRMGSDNAAAVKQKLRELRAALILRSG
jgi:hypothetical protein